MTTFEEALAAILDEAGPLGHETVSIAAALGRYLSTDFVAIHDSPHFDNSAVDGFAVRAADTASASKDSPVFLRIVTTVYAGDDAKNMSLAEGESARTMTGAAVVVGADAVVMQEDVSIEGDRAVFTSPAIPEQAVRRKGEEFRSGDLLMRKGTLCSPSVLALIASQGLDKAVVGCVPRVGVIVTGSELAEPGTALKPGQIYESNSIALSASVRSLTGTQPVSLSVGDDERATRDAFESIVEQCDVVVFSGGASVGERDLVRSTLLECGVNERFWRISMKPGKPVFFGVHPKGALVFALPGNPVSAQVTFELLVASAILKMSGAEQHSPRLERAVLGACIKRVPGRKEFIRSVTRTENGRMVADPLTKQGSHMSSGIALADRLIVLEQGTDCVEAGENVDTVPLRWSVQR